MRIVALTGALGYGYSAESLKRALEQDVDLIGVDGGSTDPGPYYLGSGKSAFTRAAEKRDLEIVIPLALERKIPFIVGSSGTSGGAPHLDSVKSIVEEIAAEKGLNFKLALIHSELNSEYVKSKLKDGKVIPFSDQLELSEDGIDSSSRIVGQVGIDPFIEALEAGADIILAGRACDTAIYASLPIQKGYEAGLAYHMAKIIECGALCAQPSAADVIIAELNEDHFTLEPGSRDLKCLVDRVAAHSLYEQTNPLYIYEPEGVADLRESEYEQVTDRMVKVSKSRFKTADKKTIKIEGAKCVGYRTICIGGSNEPKYIDRLDEIFSLIRKYVESNLPNSADSSDYSLDFKLYGGAEGICTPSAQAGIVIDAVAKTQDLANFVCGKARAALLHTDYPGRKTTAGNIAFPYSPSDLPLGPVYEFSAYHLIEVDNFSEVYQVEYKQVGI